MEIKELVRKRFIFEGVQVTEENMSDVAEWCSGEVRYTPKSVNHIKVNVTNPPSPRHTKAYIGDWVIRGTGTPTHPGVTFKVYTSRSLANNFEYFVKDLVDTSGVHYDDSKKIATEISFDWIDFKENPNADKSIVNDKPVDVSHRVWLQNSPQEKRNKTDG